MFFDDHPRFLSTSQTSADLRRLNLRHEAMIAPNRDVLAGARVLDIASHDGRWSFAALRAGAAHVVGVEAREELIANAVATFSAYDVGPADYRFVHGDIFEVLEREVLEVDVVLCLGFLYHTLRYPELMRHIADLRPHHLLVDTQVIPGRTEPLVRLSLDRTDRQRDAYPDRYGPDGHVLVGWPSVPALRMLVETYGFEVEQLFDWDALLSAHPGRRAVGDYADGRRVTARCRSTSGPEPGGGTVSP